MAAKDKKSTLLPRLRRNVIITIIEYVMMGLFALLLEIKPFNPLQNAFRNFSFTDIYYNIKESLSEPDPSFAVTIVDMTDLTDRADIARVLEDIEAAEPKVVGVDIVFEGRKDDVEADEYLAELALSNENMVFAFKACNEGDEDCQEQTHSFFADVPGNVQEGFCNYERGSLYDSVKRTIHRRTTIDGKAVPSLVGKIFSAYAEGDKWKDGDEVVGINFSPRSFAVVNADSVFRHHDLLHGRIVLLGAMHDANDTHWTPIGPMAGVELNAYALTTLLEKKEIKELPSAASWTITFLLSLLLTTFFIWYKERTASSKKPYVRYIWGSSYVTSIVSFLVTSLLMGINYVIFMSYSLNINAAWIVVTIAFIDTSKNLYISVADYLAYVKETKQTSRK